MPEKDPASYSLITWAWVILLSSWGGLVSFIKKRKQGTARPFNFSELLGELVTSGFAGIVTFLLCESSQMSPLITAAMVGISGHMGSRALYVAEKWVETKFAKIDIASAAEKGEPPHAQG